MTVARIDSKRMRCDGIVQICTKFMEGPIIQSIFFSISSAGENGVSYKSVYILTCTYVHVSKDNQSILQICTFPSVHCLSVLDPTHPVINVPFCSRKLSFPPLAYLEDHCAKVHPLFSVFGPYCAQCFLFPPRIPGEAKTHFVLTACNDRDQHARTS